MADPEKKFVLGESVIYRGRTYSFPGTVCGLTDDGQVIARAIGTPEGFYEGMKHIFGPLQLKHWEPQPSTYDRLTALRCAEIAEGFRFGPASNAAHRTHRQKIAAAIRELVGEP